MAQELRPLVAIACGGTGGHLFPGLAVAETLMGRGAEVALMVSPKEVDQVAVKAAVGLKVITLPAVGFSGAKLLKFVSGFAKSFAMAKRQFRERLPQAVLAMGSFTSAPPVLAGKASGATTFLHESNTIPGKANRWLAHMVDQAFVGFPSAASRLHNPNVVTTGTPVRSQYQPCDPASSRMALGLDPRRPVILVMGGSQGASGINELFLESLPLVVAAVPEVQVLHLTGMAHAAPVLAAYQKLPGLRSVVRPFLTEMELALGAATVAISRAGASSLAELAAMRLPAVLIPYPAATDNHQYFNARALVDAGAAWLLEQRGATADQLAQAVLRLLRDDVARGAMREALERWHAPHAADLIAEKIFFLVKLMHPQFQWQQRGSSSSSLTTPLRETA